MDHEDIQVLLEGEELHESYMKRHAAKQQALINKWEFYLDGHKFGLKPIPEKLWAPMSVIFENQLLASSRPKSEQQLTGALDLPAKWTLPMVRSIFPDLFILKICALQPFAPDSGGVGTIFYQDILREQKSGQNITVPDSNYSVGTEGSVPKRLRMTIVKETIETTKEILAATWSTEVMEDARSAMGLNVESELLSAAADEIQRAFEQRILAAILAGAGAGNVDWHTTIDEGVSTKDWAETLSHAFIEAEDAIFGYRYRKADYIVCGRNVTKWLRKSQTFLPAPVNQLGTNPYTLGVEMVGTLTGMWDVYTTVYLNENKAIMGCYPRSVTDAGYIFSPYIPIAPMPLVYAEYVYDEDSSGAPHGMYRNTDMWSRNIRSRNGHRLAVPELFATVSLVS